MIRKNKLLLVLLLCVFMACTLRADADTVVTQDKVIVFQIGLPYYLVDSGSGYKETKMDVSPYVRNSRTYVPVRFLGNALGVNDQNIDWNPATRKVTLKGEKEMVLTIGSMAMQSGSDTVQMDVAPEIKSGRTMLPARYVAEGLGYKVDWDPTNKLVICTKGDAKVDVQAVLKKINQLAAVNGYDYYNDVIKFDYTGWPEREECLKYGGYAFERHIKIDKQAGTITLDLPRPPKGSLWWIDLNYMVNHRDYMNQFSEKFTHSLPVSAGGRYVFTDLPFSKMTRCIMEVGLSKADNTLNQTPSAAKGLDVLKNTYRDLIMGG